MSKTKSNSRWLQRHFDVLNAAYFDNALQGTELGWLRRTKGPRKYVIFGYCYYEINLIQLSPLLLLPQFQDWYASYYMFHEMLHLLYPPVVIGGRLVQHHPVFLEAEKRFVHYDRIAPFEQALREEGTWKRLRELDMRTISLPKSDVEG